MEISKNKAKMEWDNRMRMVDGKASHHPRVVIRLLAYLISRRLAIKSKRRLQIKMVVIWMIQTVKRMACSKMGKSKTVIQMMKMERVPTVIKPTAMASVAYTLTIRKVKIMV